MTIAQRIERLLESDGEDMAGAADSLPVDDRPAPRLSVVPASRNNAPPEARRTSESAIDLLNEVTRAFPAVMARCEQLEAALVSVREHARVEVEAAHQAAQQAVLEWQHAANRLKQQVESLEKGLRVTKQRADHAEDQLTAMKDQVARSQHAAAEAECLSSLFEDRVISSFGIGSVMHPILENLRAKGGGQLPG